MQKYTLLPLFALLFLVMPSGYTGHGVSGHLPLDISAEKDVPQILDVHITRDIKSGWNIQVITEHFAFNPEAANTDHVMGEGHAHLYVDGKKYARLYGHWFHLPDLAEGEHRVTVSLNANDHSPLLYKGRLIEHSQLIEQPMNVESTPHHH